MHNNSTNNENNEAKEPTIAVADNAHKAKAAAKKQKKKSNAAAASSATNSKQQPKKLDAKEAERLWHQLVEEAIFKIQTSLVENAQVSEKYLLFVAQLLQPQHYEDVVSERNLAQLCGYPLCSKPVEPSSAVLQRLEKAGRFKIDIQNHRVLDRYSNVYNRFCCDDCMLKSSIFKTHSLSMESPQLRATRNLKLLQMLFPNMKYEQIVKIRDIIEKTIIKEAEGPKSTMAIQVKEKYDGPVPKRPVQLMYGSEPTLNTSTNSESNIDGYVPKNVRFAENQVKLFDKTQAPKDVSLAVNNSEPKAQDQLQHKFKRSQLNLFSNQKL